MRKDKKVKEKNTKSKQKERKQRIYRCEWARLRFAKKSSSKSRRTHTCIEKDNARTFDTDSIIDNFNNMKDRHNLWYLTLVDRFNWIYSFFVLHVHVTNIIYYNFSMLFLIFFLKPMNMHIVVYLFILMLATINVKSWLRTKFHDAEMQSFRFFLN